MEAEEESWCEGKCGSERERVVGGVLGFEREWQLDDLQSKRMSSFVGSGRAEASCRKKSRESGDVGFMVKFVKCCTNVCKLPRVGVGAKRRGRGWCNSRPNECFPPSGVQSNPMPSLICCEFSCSSPNGILLEQSKKGRRKRSSDAGK